MLRPLSLVVTAFLLCGGSAIADTEPDLGTNAALTYWQAFATLPKLADAEQNVLTHEYTTMPLDARARELVTSAEYALRMMHRGAAVRPCNWGINWNAEGAETRLPQLSAARVLIALASVRARMSFEGGRTQAAVDDMVAALTLGRQVSLDGSLIGVLTGYATEAGANEVLAMYLPRLDANMLKDLQSRLGSLPPGGRPATAMKDCEANTVEWIGDRAKATKDMGELLKLVIDLGLVAAKDPDQTDKARALLEACGGTKAGFLKHLEELKPAYALVAPKLDLPLDQSEKEIERVSKDLAANPLFKVLFPSALACRRAQARTEIRRALLATAIDMQLNGRDALKNHLDPVTSVPFEMVSFDGGFELLSTRIQPPIPLTLSVGQRKK
jgi:hypothetical protein